ncbi:MAG: phosphatidylinositol-specific phospholipase C domain-containing protein [Chitinophagales bacterium]
MFEQSNKFQLIGIFCLLFIAFSCKKENNANAPADVLLKRSYDSVCFLMTHNAMNNSEKGFTIPNQTYSITHQLKNGVRGLMIDTYDGDNGVALTYHVTPIFGSEKLVDVLIEIKNFMLANPKEIISIIFENNGSNSQLIKAIDSSGLNNYSYIHTGGTKWPTLQALIDSNQRLVLFVEQDKSPKINYLMYAWGTIFDTPYTFKSVSEFNSNVNRGGSGTKELYLVNHWLSNALGMPDKNLAPQANTRAVLGKRVQDCSSANHHFINYLGVDFFEIGAAKAIVDSINGL